MDINRIEELAFQKKWGKDTLILKEKKDIFIIMD